MAFGLAIGTERATALQNSIQDELTTRGYSPDADPVMAEYITIMIINNKTPAQITAELQELIGPDFDSSFVDWLFEEAAKGSPEAEAAPAATPVVAAPAANTASTAPPSSTPQNALPAIPSQPLPQGPGQQQQHRRPGPGGLYQQAMSSLPGIGAGAKRTRSPSPGHANKSRRTDLPTGPRAMGGGGRSLLERMGGRGYAKDDIQARIDNITGAGAPGGMGMNGPPMNVNPAMGMNGPVGMNGMPMNMNGMPPMDMNMMAAAAAAQGGMGIPNPMMLQEMMMNQMALMAQMAGAMGMLPPGQSPQPPQGQFGEMNGERGRGGMRGRGRGRGAPGGGRGGHGGNAPAPASIEAPVEAPAPPIHAPAPIPAAVQAAHQHQPQHPRPAPPTRPLSPSLCKFGWKCTNVQCRWSHPSPVATAESGVVLSNDPCEKGAACKDKDCVKAHVSPAAARAHNGEPAPNGTTPSATTTPSIPPPSANATPTLNPSAPSFTPSPSIPATSIPSAATPPTSHMATIPCRYGLACTRPGCAYMHPAGHPLHRPHSYNAGAGRGQVACRFGAACTRAGCSFAHPEGRGVLPGTFHRGLGIDGVAGETKNRSVVFNTSKPAADGATKEKAEVDGAAKDGAAKDKMAADLERRVKEVEEKKNAAQNALREREAARKKAGVEVKANGA